MRTWPGSQSLAAARALLSPLRFAPPHHDSSARGKHYYGRVAERPTGSLAAECQRHPSMTPNEIIIADPIAYPRHTSFPFEVPARFPHALATQHHAADLSVAQVRELKAGYPALVATYVAARCAAGRPLTHAEATGVDAPPMLVGWTAQWGLEPPQTPAPGAALACELIVP